MNKPKSWPYIFLSLLMLVLFVFVSPRKNDVSGSTSSRRNSEGLAYHNAYDGGGKLIGYSVAGLGLCTDNEIVIPSTHERKPVVSIEDEAFLGASISSVVIPSSVERIGSRAFESCENLRKVELNEGLIEILDSAFLSCYQLETVTIPSTVDKIGSMAFGYCTAMTKLLIGENVRTIESSAFSHCRSLVTVKVPDSVESLGENVFFACEGLRSVALSKYIEVVPARTFSGCVSLQDVELRGRVRIVDVDAFRDCKQLNNVSFSDSLELICERAFANCAVLTISYSGSTSMWRNQVYTERYWNEGIISLPVSCSDGTIEMK